MGTHQTQYELPSSDKISSLTSFEYFCMLSKTISLQQVPLTVHGGRIKSQVKAGMFGVRHSTWQNMSAAFSPLDMICLPSVSPRTDKTKQKPSVSPRTDEADQNMTAIIQYYSAKLDKFHELRSG